MSKQCLIGNPISCNEMYAPIGRGKLVKTKKYRSWIEKNIPIIKNNLLPPTKFPITIDVLVMANIKWMERHDPDNLLKPIMDLLVNSQIIPDDNNRYIEQVSCRFLYCPGPSSDVLTRISYEEPDEIIED